MRCPRCSKNLVIENVEGEEISVCRSCGGMWVHKHQLDHLLKESGGDVEACSIESRERGDDHNIVRCRECPDQPMKKISFLDYSNIVMDYCPSCGSFWLDGNELSRMHRYLKRIEKEGSKAKGAAGFTIMETLSRIAYSIFR